MTRGVWALIRGLLPRTGAVVGGAPVGRRRVATVGGTVGAVVFSVAVYGGACGGCDRVASQPPAPPTAPPTATVTAPTPPVVTPPTGGDAGVGDAGKPPEPPAGACREGIEWRAVPAAGRSELDCTGRDAENPACRRSRIVGGSNLSLAEAPWMVSLQTPWGSHFCGGAVYCPTTYQCAIVTAAHCMVPETVGAGLRAVVGREHLRTNEGTEIEVSPRAVRVHARYSDRTFDFDVATILLDEPPGVEPIEFAAARDSITVDIQGWGRLYDGGPISPPLQGAVVPVIPTVCPECSVQCSSYYTHLTERMFCADTVGVGSCQGDSGSPVTVDKRLVGIVSHGRGCAASAPGVYADALALRPWIEACSR